MEEKWISSVFSRIFLLFTLFLSLSWKNFFSSPTAFYSPNDSTVLQSLIVLKNDVPWLRREILITLIYFHKKLKQWQKENLICIKLYSILSEIYRDDFLNH